MLFTMSTPPGCSGLGTAKFEKLTVKFDELPSKLEELVGQP